METLAWESLTLSWEEEGIAIAILEPLELELNTYYKLKSFNFRPVQLLEALLQLLYILHETTAMVVVKMKIGSNSKSFEAAKKLEDLQIQM